MMRRARIFSARELGAGEVAAWQSLRDGAQVYRSPFFAPGFIAAIGAVRPDVRVAMCETDGRPALGFAYHRRPGAFVRPIGAPWSDWQGPVMAPDIAFDPGDLLDVVGGDAIRYTGLADPFGRFQSGRLRSADSWFADLAGGAKAYRAALETQQKSNLANTRRVFRRAEREIGPVRFTMNDPDRGAFDQLMAWKRQRYAETGSYDILAVRWVEALMDRLWDQRDEQFGGVLSTVRFGDKIAGATFHLRDDAWWSAWIMGYDPQFHALGPGRILIDQFLQVADEHGVAALEFGPGGDEYKSKWCLHTLPVYEALWHGHGVAGRVRATARRGWHGVAKSLGPANRVLERARSRTDHICAAHANWIGASKGIASTVFGRRPKIVAEATS